MIQFKDPLPIDLRRAKATANKLANLTGVNHVIVKIGNNYSVYSEKEYPNGYLELVEPERNVTKEAIEPEKEEVKPIKKRVNAVSKA